MILVYEGEEYYGSVNKKTHYRLYNRKYIYTKETFSLLTLYNDNNSRDMAIFEIVGAPVIDFTPEEIFSVRLKRATNNELKRLVKAGFQILVLDFLEIDVDGI